MITPMAPSAPTIAWLNGEFIPADALHVSVDDVGFRQGVVAVERMRTYDGKVAALGPHLVRWRRTAEQLCLRVAVDLREISDRVEQLLRYNRDWLAATKDCGLVMVATPGPVAGGALRSRPTEILHLIAIDHDKVIKHRSSGQPLFITDVEQPSGKCWPRDIKVRCRLHYYLADHQAREHHPDAVGLLIDHDGTVTEASVANVAIVRDRRVIAPPDDQVLPGITQQTVRKACEEQGVVWQVERLWPAEIREAEEVWLMGTDGGLWFANRVDGAAKNGELPGPVYARVLPAFDRYVRAA